MLRRSGVDQARWTSSGSGSAWTRSWFLILFLMIFWLSGDVPHGAAQLRRRRLPDHGRHGAGPVRLADRARARARARRPARGDRGAADRSVPVRRAHADEPRRRDAGRGLQDRRRRARSRRSGSCSCAWRSTWRSSGPTGWSTRPSSTARCQITPVLLSLSWLLFWNVLLLVFNLVPAFPLDGGRIARAIVWRVTGEKQRGTRIAARLGQGFAAAAGRRRRVAACSRIAASAGCG